MNFINYNTFVKLQNEKKTSNKKKNSLSPELYMNFKLQTINRKIKNISLSNTLRITQTSNMENCYIKTIYNFKRV